MENTQVFELIDLDVWGNEYEGWEINAAYRLGFSLELTLKQYEDDFYLIDLLINAGYLTKEARELIDVEGDNGFLTFINIENSKPLYQLQML